MGNESNDKRQILRAVNNDNKHGNGKGNYMAKNVVVVNCESRQQLIPVRMSQNHVGLR